MKTSAFTLSALLLPVAFGQTYQFTHITRPNDLEQVATLVRVIANISQVTIDPARKTMVYQGNEAAHWLLRELDQPVHDSTPHEFRVAEGDVVRVFYLRNAANVQSLQEIATAVRATVEIQKLFTFTAHNAVAIRGTPLQSATAAWLFAQLDRPSGMELTPSDEYRMQGVEDGVIQVLYAHTDTVQSLQEVATAMRATTEVRRFFTYNRLRAIMVRGTADQLKMVRWLFAKLDQPPSNADPQFQRSGDPEGVVRVFRLAHSGSVADLQQVATLIRSIGEIRSLFTYNAPRAVIVRGSSGEVDLADWLVRELDTPAVFGKPVYRLTEAADDQVGILRVPGADTSQRLQETAVQVRTTTGARRLFTYQRQSVIVLRGTGAQLAQAEQLILDRN